MRYHQVGKRVTIIVAGVLSLSMVSKEIRESIKPLIISRTSLGRNHPKPLRVCELLWGDAVASGTS